MKPQQVKLIDAPGKEAWKQPSDVLIAMTTQEFKNVLDGRATGLPKALCQHLSRFAAARKIKATEQLVFQTDLDAERRAVVSVLQKSCTMFELLTLMRKAYAAFGDHKPTRLLVSLDCAGAMEPLLVDAVISAINTAHHSGPHYGKKPKLQQRPKITLLCSPNRHDEYRARIDAAIYTSDATNQIRTWSAMAGNDLNVKNYIKLTKDLAGEHGLGWKRWDYQKLKSLGANAFCAVAQGSAEQDASIVAITYRPREAPKPPRSLILVGKGVVYDTGGVNLKPAHYMHGMHGDMGGSAVALSLVCLAAREQWPIEVTCYLAIAENAISATVYRPNDVVTSLSGKVIEVVHTDAEGRMMLTDTLTLATRETNTDLLIDFATLTGACVGAIGKAYSGGFTNRLGLVPQIIEAGRASGERVWPFPLDEDFGECLKSETADIKQCRLRGGVDHIEAAWFLKQFIKGDPAWVHIDLSAAESEGDGLAHVAGNYTGFGARFGAALIKKYFTFD